MGRSQLGPTMDMQYLYRSCFYVAFLAGIAGVCFAHSFRPSGKRALAVALIAFALVSARIAILSAWFDISGIGHLFC